MSAPRAATHRVRRAVAPALQSRPPKSTGQTTNGEVRDGGGETHVGGRGGPPHTTTPHTASGIWFVLSVRKRCLEDVASGGREFVLSARKRCLEDVASV